MIPLHDVKTPGVPLLRLIAFGLIAAAAVGYAFLFNSAEAAGSQLRHYGYFGVLFTFLWWVWSLLRIARPTAIDFLRGGAPWWKAHSRAIVLILGLVVVARLTVPYAYKVLYDEAVLQSTAFNLHFLRELGTVMRAHEVEGYFRPLTVYLDKRPFFYPFLVSLVHDLAGYRVVNAHILNTLLLPVVLSLLYWVGLALGGCRGALVGMACFGASSLLAQNANGAGMDLLNLAMFLLTLGLAVGYLRRPDEHRLSALVLSCVLLAQTRYESVLYIAPVALVIVDGWRRAGRIILPAAALVAPLLLVPAGLQHTYLSGTPLLWELRDDLSARFSSEHVAVNLRHAGIFFFHLSGRLLNTFWLSLAGFASLLWVIWFLARRPRGVLRGSGAGLATILFGLTAVANLGLLMFYFWGQLDDPIVSRLVLPFHAVLGLTIAWAVRQLPAPRRIVVARWLTTGALLSYLGFGLPASTHHNRINHLATEMAWEEKWVAQRAEVPRLIITNKTALNWITLRTSALAADIANGRVDGLRFHFRAGTFHEILVFQYYRPIGPDGGFILDPKDKLDDAIVLEPLHERQFAARLLRISRVVEIRDRDQAARSEKDEFPRANVALSLTPPAVMVAPR